ncbi:hypothetical protein BD324DRAFT_648175 [Kockovaella imperatae]|uniref:NADH dehydrogenase [ubiquinone] iron-sulfur protein 5 n=1 Tax=Kockovaella imperatae TaxID=4999 RepID=A0A1Y1UUQ0_9TREE|nr:hypothetical protein BD324DRAFT_648175 [Kockovaella imperatae]ORX41304.1 hypothetical protein BD324DRAFT_648175 [Kockovaella imperatae]
MSNALGLNGGNPRCWAHLMEFQRCWKSAQEPQECKPQHEDYIECLHRKKEQASSAKEAAEKAAAGTIISLGLVEDPTAGGKDEEKQ